MRKELKKAIIEWLFGNPNGFYRVIKCMQVFRPYIFDGNGNYLIMGNMSYCRFENTYYDLLDCVLALKNGDVLQLQKIVPKLRG